MTSRVIDQDAAHHVGSDGEEVRAVVPHLPKLRPDSRAGNRAREAAPVEYQVVRVAR
jgi:hypothetical protein